MISDIYIQRTEEKENNRKIALNKIYNEFIEKINKLELKKIDNKYLFLRINLQDKNYKDDDSYIVNVNNDPLVSAYGISCSDIVNKINEIFIREQQPFKCIYNINWSCGHGIFGLWNKIRGNYPYVKCVNFLVMCVSYCAITNDK